MYLRQALDLYQQLGVSEVDNVATILVELDPTTDEHDELDEEGDTGW